MNRIKQSFGTLESNMLRALNVNLQNSLTERYNIDKVVEDDSVNNDWASSSAFLDLQQRCNMHHNLSIFWQDSFSVLCKFARENVKPLQHLHVRMDCCYLLNCFQSQIVVATMLITGMY